MRQACCSRAGRLIRQRPRLRCRIATRKNAGLRAAFGPRASKARQSAHRALSVTCGSRWSCAAAVSSSAGGATLSGAGKHPKRPVPAAQPSPLSELAAAYRRCQARKASKPSAARLTAAATRCKSVPFHSISTVCSPAGISTVSSPEVGGRVDSRGLTASMRACQPGSRRSSGAAQTAVRHGAQREAIKSPRPQERRAERRCGSTLSASSVSAIRPAAGTPGWRCCLHPPPAHLVNLDLGEYGRGDVRCLRREDVHPCRRGCWLKTMRPMVAAVRVARRGVVRGCRATPPANNARGSERSASSRHANWMTDSTSMLSQRAAPRCP